MANRPIVYTRHALHAIEQRVIETDWVERAVLDPDWTESDTTTPGAERKFKAIVENGNRILRVACFETDAGTRILTAFFDRKAKP